MSATFHRLSRAQRLPPSDGAEVYRLLPSAAEADETLPMTDLDAMLEDRGAGRRAGLAHEQPVRLVLDHGEACELVTDLEVAASLR